MPKVPIELRACIRRTKAVLAVDHGPSSALKMSNSGKHRWEEVDRQDTEAGDSGRVGGSFALLLNERGSVADGGVGVGVVNQGHDNTYYVCVR